MTNKDFNYILSGLNQIKVNLKHESRGEEYIEDTLDALEDLIFDFEQGYLNDESAFILYENPYCQKDFV